MRILAASRPIATLEHVEAGLEVAKPLWPLAEYRRPERAVEEVAISNPRLAHPAVEVAACMESAWAARN